MSRFSKNSSNKFGRVPHINRVINEHNCKCAVLGCCDEDKNEACCLDEIPTINELCILKEHKENVKLIIEDEPIKHLYIVDEIIPPTQQPPDEIPPQQPPEEIVTEVFLNEVVEEQEPTESKEILDDVIEEPKENIEESKEEEDMDDNATVSTEWVEEEKEEVEQTVVKTVIKVRKPKSKIAKIKSLFL